MSIRVVIDVYNPLFRMKKLIPRNGMAIYVIFKYERLSTYHYICGRLGYFESYYKLHIHPGMGSLKSEWDDSLKANSHHKSILVNRLLRDDTRGRLLRTEDHWLRRWYGWEVGITQNCYYLKFCKITSNIWCKGSES